METTSVESLLQTRPEIESSKDDLVGELTAFLREHRGDILDCWQSRTERAEALQSREVAPDREAQRDVLERFYDLVDEQLRSSGDAAQLKAHIRPAVLDTFSLDVSWCLLIVLKYALLDTLRSAYTGPSGRREDLFFCAEAAMDEMLLRVAEAYHEARNEEVQRQADHRGRVLRNTQDRLRTLLETMNEGFTAIDTTACIFIFNRRMEQITGYSKEEVIGKHAATIYTPDSQKRLEAQLAGRREGKRSSYGLHVAHKDGRRVPIRVSGAPLHNEQDDYIGSFAVVTDISERVRAEEELLARNREIARLLDGERKRRAHFETINQVAQMALTTLDPDEIFHRVVEAVQGRFGSSHASLFLVEPGSDQMVM